MTILQDIDQEQTQLRKKWGSRILMEKSLKKLRRKRIQISLQGYKEEALNTDFEMARIL
jgi:hypothetical protein